jgi:hypothetical protein
MSDRKICKIISFVHLTDIFVHFQDACTSTISTNCLNADARALKATGGTPEKLLSHSQVTTEKRLDTTWKLPGSYWRAVQGANQITASPPQQTASSCSPLQLITDALIHHFR